jgi:hypothetical protein
MIRADKLKNKLLSPAGIILLLLAGETFVSSGLNAGPVRNPFQSQEKAQWRVISNAAGSALCQDSNKPSVLPHSTNQDVRLRVVGRRIVDGNGNPVRLRGIYTRAEWLSCEQEVKWFKEWGVNFVRILLTHDEDYWQAVNDGVVDYKKRCIVRRENLEHTDKRIQWLQDHNIYFIMEIHWRALGIDEKFTEPELLKRQLTSMYSMLAEQYKDYDHLMGFCMFSEIYVAKQYYEIYNEICTAIVDEIHRVDPSYIVSATGVQTSSPDSMIDAVYIDRPNVIYDFHFYSPKMFTHYRNYYGDIRYPGWIADGWTPGVELVDMGYLRRKLQPAFDFSERWNVPVWCGEFGAFGNAPDNSSPRWERDVYYILEQRNVPWILWRWKEKNKVIPDYWKQFWQGTYDTNTVTIVPHGGPFANVAYIKIDSTVTDSEIRYTTDGSKPNLSSPIYTNLFKITESTTVKAAAFKNGTAVTDVDEASFYELEGREPDNPENISEGILYSYFECNRNEIADLENIKPVKTGVVENISRNVADRENEIAIEFTGYLKVPEDGLYYFYSSDAGASKLWIGDVMLIDNPESRWLSRRSGFTGLKAGFHPIKVLYWRADKAEVYYSQNKKNEYLMIEYEGPGIKRQEIPASALYHSISSK